MADYPPYMNAYGRIATILEKIKLAATPDRFTSDFLATKLKAKGGSAKTFIGLAKRIGFLASDGSPTDLYKRFRNSGSSKASMAAAIKQGYSSLYESNEYAHDLDKAGLAGLVMEVTGLSKEDKKVGAICRSFEALKSFADFDKPLKEDDLDQSSEGLEDDSGGSSDDTPGEELRLNLAYTINLVLPKTDDIAVFNAIFKSLRNHIIRR